MATSYLKSKKLLRAGAFLDNKFCKNRLAYNFFAIWLRMLISFWNDVHIGCCLELINGLWKYKPVFFKNP